MIEMTAAAFSLFFLLTGLALFRLRVLDPLTQRPFRVPGYPVLPLLFCAWCAVLFMNSVLSSFWLSLLGLVLVVTGLPLYFLPKKLGKSSRPSQPILTQDSEVLGEPVTHS
jgi:amino acid transporter